MDQQEGGALVASLLVADWVAAPGPIEGRGVGSQLHGES
jgi:hypothetical protein